MVTAAEIAGKLGRTLHGPDGPVDRVSLPRDARSGSLVWIKKHSEEWEDRLNAVEGLFAIVPHEFEGRLQIAHVLSNSPKLDFAKAAALFAPAPKSGIASTAIIAGSARIGENVSIGHYTVIHDEVEIGDGTVIGDQVVIKEGCRIGRDCWIKSGAIIGEPGFGFAFEATGEPVRIPHLGSVVIGDDCEIGSCTTVMRGTIEDTVLKNRVKVDDLVLIAHNVTIDDNSIIPGGATICGSAKIGRNVWVGAHSTIINQTEVGEHSMVGLGAVVVEPVKPWEVVMGPTAKHLKMRRKPGEG
jgi:UDP-3-O-[3-hydroxymyristoyl] glucosamine N-acyltransferase